MCRTTVVQEFERGLHFGSDREAAEELAIGPVDAGLVGGAGGGGRAGGERARTFEHERAVEEIQFLQGGGCDAALFGVDVGVGVVELEQDLVQLQPADARIDGAAVVREVI